MDMTSRWIARPIAWSAAGAPTAAMRVARWNVHAHAWLELSRPVGTEVIRP
jgi:hypothetical protein